MVTAVHTDHHGRQEEATAAEAPRLATLGKRSFTLTVAFFLLSFVGLFLLSCCCPLNKPG